MFPDWCQDSSWWAKKHSRLSKQYARYVANTLRKYTNGPRQSPLLCLLVSATPCISPWMNVFYVCLMTLWCCLRKCAKLNSCYCGPFVVIKCIDSFAYLLVLLQSILSLMLVVSMWSWVLMMIQFPLKVELLLIIWHPNLIGWKEFSILKLNVYIQSYSRVLN